MIVYHHSRVVQPMRFLNLPFVVNADDTVAAGHLCVPSIQYTVLREQQNKLGNHMDERVRQAAHQRARPHNPPRTSKRAS